jgi:hypothetical protein
VNTGFPTEPMANILACPLDLLGQAVFKFLKNFFMGISPYFGHKKTPKAGCFQR